jgi:flavin-dependent dehydrogenase
MSGVGLDGDALIVGAGPAGAAAAILLAQAGWRVMLVEQQRYPRQKVCGECMSAGSLGLLDELGVGALVRQRAGPELRRVAWMRGASVIVAELPACTQGPYPFGRALGRDHLDALLVERARGLGVEVCQPATLRSVRADDAGFECVIGSRARRDPGRSVRVSVVIDAHGSWEAGPLQQGSAAGGPPCIPHRASDLFGFKASFQGSTLARGLLPVLSMVGGYGGMVQAEDGRLTLACCIRRDLLAQCRARSPGLSAGEAVLRYLSSCRGVLAAVEHAERLGPWYCVGPIRPGIRSGSPYGPLCIGNAAGETHPLIGEGITMALQSAFLLCHTLAARAPGRIDAAARREIHRCYRRAWRAAFERRVRFASAYAQLAMRPALSRAAEAVLRRWPGTLTEAARWAGKARVPFASPPPRAATL